MTDSPKSVLSSRPGARDSRARTVTARGLILWAACLAGLLVITTAVSVTWGYSSLNADVVRARLLRLASAMVVGGGLAVAGVALQSLLRNALADPYVLGISSGSGVGVLAGMMLSAHGLGQTWSNVPLMAGAGALLTVGVVYLVAQRRGRLDPYTLLLAGVIVNAFNGAVMLFIYLYLSPYLIAGYLGWAMGRIPENPELRLLACSGGLMLAGWLYVLLRAQAFNVQSLGDDVAGSSGVNVHFLRLGTFIVVSLMTASAVALAGPIGFIGLIVPHMCRLILGPDHRLLVIASGFVGAIFLVVADTFCRLTVLTFGGELPVGIITAFCGGPFFIYLLRRRFGEGMQ